jgi:serine protease Do
MHLPQIADDVQREVERSWKAMPRDFAFDFNWEGEMPEVAVFPRGRLGARLMPLSDQLAQYFGAKQGVLVSSVDDDSPAAKAGLRAGDVITSVGGTQVQTPRDVAREIRETDSGDVEIAVLRDKKSLTLKAPVPERRRTVRRPARPA